MTSTHTFPFAEVKLAEATGLSAREFRFARKGLQRGADWETIERRTMLSETGFYGVLVALGLAYKRPDGSFGDAAGFVIEKLKLLADVELCQKKPILLGRIERFPMNRFLVLVRLADKSLVSVWIPRDRQKLKKGMEVPVRAAPYGARYELARPMPRRPGRW